MWKFTKDDDFSTNSAYLSSKAEMGVENTFKGAWIWKLDTIPKITELSMVMYAYQCTCEGGSCGRGFQL